MFFYEKAKKLCMRFNNKRGSEPKLVIKEDDNGDAVVELNGKKLDNDILSNAIENHGIGYISNGETEIANEDVVMEQGEYDPFPQGVFAEIVPLVADKEYTVVFDGTPYTLTAWTPDGSSNVILGDVDGEMSYFDNYPFVIGTNDSVTFVSTKDPGTHNFVIRGQSEEVHQIDSKFVSGGGSGGGLYKVNCTIQTAGGDINITMDKTYQEILGAINGGALPYLFCTTILYDGYETQSTYSYSVSNLTDNSARGGQKAAHCFSSGPMVEDVFDTTMYTCNRVVIDQDNVVTFKQDMFALPTT